ncbi:winged helix-turn-helix domain-containing protein [Streptomyces sp. NPDC048362]|uniref:winged helix-turn-helix domain-containing protein n=1 Tax=Streptomyces sp. NPDC048362 TaxID=3365539 RepID=UPI00371FF398
MQGGRLRRGGRQLRRHGWSWQAPARRALERDEHAVELWTKEVWPRVKGALLPYVWVILWRLTSGELGSGARRG